MIVLGDRAPEPAADWDGPRMLTGDSRLAAAHEAATRIRSLWEVGRVVMDLVQAQTMEALQTIREAMPDRDRFGAFVEEFTPLDAGEAWLMAETWLVARDRSDLRALALRAPDEALDLVRDAVRAGIDLADPEDEQVVRILSLSGRQRHSAMRKLIAAGEAESRAAVADEAAAGTAPASRVPQPRRDGADHLVAALSRELRTLGELAMDASVVLADEADEGQRAQVAGICEALSTTVDRIQAMCA